LPARARVFRDLATALKELPQGELLVIGGAELYRQACRGWPAGTDPGACAVEGIRVSALRCGRSGARRRGWIMPPHESVHAHAYSFLTLDRI